MVEGVIFCMIDSGGPDTQLTRILGLEFISNSFWNGQRGAINNQLGPRNASRNLGETYLGFGSIRIRVAGIHS